MANFTTSATAVNSDWLFPGTRGGTFTVEETASDRFTIKYEFNGTPGEGLQVTFVSNANNFVYDLGGPISGTFSTINLTTGGSFPISLGSWTGLASTALTSFASASLAATLLSGNDTLVGNFGNDILRGDAGENVYVGKGGNDIFVVDEDDFDTEIHGSNQDGSGGAGEKNTIEFHNSLGLRTNLITDIDAVTFAVGTNSVADFQGANLGGLSSKLLVTGDAGANTLAFHSVSAGSSFNLSHLAFSNWAATDNVLLDGSESADILIGSKRNDTISGEGGIDVLVGGRGRDILSGGDEADRFDYNSKLDSRKGAKHDIIDDFSHDDLDRIDLKTIDANTHLAGNQKFHFIGSKAFHHREGELRFNNGLVQGDVNGDGRADFEIQVESLTDLVRADFIL
jgi:serralysin